MTASMERLAGPAAATAQASLLATNWMLFLYVGMGVGALVWGLILFAVLRWRRTSDEGELPPQFRDNVTLELGWTIVPLLLVGALFIQTYRAEAGVEALVPKPDVSVAVNGYRWGWRFAYRDGPTLQGSVANPPQLLLPRGETTRLTLTSSDVIHSFWIPAFLFKRDAIPGRETAFDLTPQESGTYVGHCAEFCGFQHALMGFSVRVVPATDYERWRREAAP